MISFNITLTFKVHTLKPERTYIKFPIIISESSSHEQSTI